MLKALLFDLDGTIADTNSVHRLAWVEMLEPYGYDVDWDFYRENITGRIATDVVADLSPGFSPEEVQEIAEAKEANFREQAGSLKPFPGLLELIESGRKTGMEIALVTNAPKENVFTVLRVLGLEDAFEPVILAEEVGVGKPDPAPYNAALEALNISADEAVAFEDSPSGIASSVAAGIPTVGIASTQEPEDLEGPGVELIVHDFTDRKLIALIEGR
ncbi:MAG: Beta-phosphoglucomutase [uncultured Rubrobacteraceae bacterium]|uniref:Beta-phosphoglucomutase n=1 Tax=uncultured Rubrobacteraceae bacterium TaxID=349277 RepID=A0A6J4QS28_9ACTN|nr:MAG: Beta-phosphoglucomutase [uncultured Rubrobacteraceae bacterium]